MSQGGSRRPYSRGGQRWRYKEYWDYEQNYSDATGSVSPKECTTPPIHKHDARFNNNGLLGGAGGSRRVPASGRRRSGSSMTSPPSPVFPTSSPDSHHEREHHHSMSYSGNGSRSEGEMSSKAQQPLPPKRRRVHNNTHHNHNDSSGVNISPPRRLFPPPGFSPQVPWPHRPLLIDINQMSLRSARPTGGWSLRRDRTMGEMWSPGGVAPPLRYHQVPGLHYELMSAAGPPDPLPPPFPPSTPLAPPHFQDVQHANTHDLLLLESRGAGLELVPHHLRGRVSGVMGRQRSFVRHHHARWPHQLTHHHLTHHHHHHHAQSGSNNVNVNSQPMMNSHMQQIHVAQLPPPPTYQVFLNLLAMFPLSPFAMGGGVLPERDEAMSPQSENYEALLSLAERMGEAKCRGLTKHEIDLLPTYKYSDTSRGEQQSCVVCMCEFESRQTLRVLPCAHEFHARCVDKWLRSNRTCPICRGNASEYFSNPE